MAKQYQRVDRDGQVIIGLYVYRKEIIVKSSLVAGRRCKDMGEYDRIMLHGSNGSCLTFSSKKICYPELQIRGSIEDNSKIFFLNSQRNHIL